MFCAPVTLQGSKSGERRTAVTFMCTWGISWCGRASMRDNDEGGVKNSITSFSRMAIAPREKCRLFVPDSE